MLQEYTLPRQSKIIIPNGIKNHLPCSAGCPNTVTFGPSGVVIFITFLKNQVELTHFGGWWRAQSGTTHQNAPDIEDLRTSCQAQNQVGGRATQSLPYRNLPHSSELSLLILYENSQNNRFSQRFKITDRLPKSSGIDLTGWWTVAPPTIRA